jgi:hypothetical protein
MNQNSLILLFARGGIFMWYLLIIAIIVILSAGKSFFNIISQKSKDKSPVTGINAVFLFSGIAPLIGIIGWLRGFFIATTALIPAHDISGAIICFGLALSLIPVIFGFWIFLIGIILWFILHAINNKLTESS